MCFACKADTPCEHPTKDCAAVAGEYGAVAPEEDRRRYPAACRGPRLLRLHAESEKRVVLGAVVEKLRLQELPRSRRPARGGLDRQVAVVLGMRRWRCRRGALSLPLFAAHIFGGAPTDALAQDSRPDRPTDGPGQPGATAGLPGWVSTLRAALVLPVESVACVATHHPSRWHLSCSLFMRRNDHNHV